MADDNVFLIRTAISLAGLRRDIPRLLTELNRLQQKVAKGGGLTSFASGIDNLKKKQQAFGRSVRGDGFDHMNKKVKEGSAGVKKLNVGMQNTSNTIADVGRRVFIWGSLSAAIFGAFQSAKEFLNVTIKINSAMADLRKVLPRKEDFAFLKKETFTLAIEFGRDPIDVIKTLRRFAQAGLESAEALKATEVSMIAMNATGANVEQSINALIGANRIFNISWDNMSTVMDKVMRLQADFAIDAKDLIASITAIGPAITVLGGDIDDLFSTIAALGEAARISGKEASNSLKRVFARITTKEGIKVLQDIGVAVMATVDSYRPLRDIFSDINDRWDGLSAVQKKNLATTLAQVRQYSKFLALLNNFDRAQEALEKSINAFGDASRANRIEMETYEKRIASANAQTTEFFEGLYNAGIAETFTSLKRALGDVSSLLNKLPQTFVIATAGIIGAMVALKGLSLAVRGFTAANRAVFATGAMGGMVDVFRYSFTRKALFWKDYTRSVGIGKGAISATIPKMSRLAGMLGVIGIAAAITVPLIYKLADAHKKYGLVLDEAEKYIKKFKDSLKDVDIRGILAYDTERKFNKIKDAFKDFSDILKKTGNESQAFKESFSNIFTGVNLADANVEELEKLKTVLTDLHSLVVNKLSKPIEEQVILITRDMVKAFENTMRKMEKDAAEGGKNIRRGFGIGLSAIDQEFPIGAGIVAVERTFREQTYALINQIDASRKSLREAARDAGKPIDEYFDILFNNFERASQKAIEFHKIMRTTVDFDFPAVEVGYAEAIDDAAKAYLEMYDITRIVTESMEELGLKFKEGYKPISDAGVVTAKVKERLLDLVEAKVKAALAAGDMVRAMELVDKIMGKIEKKTEAQKFWVIALAPTAILSAVKKSISSVISGYNAQIDVIKKVAEISEKAGVSYNKYTEALKASEQATKAIISRTKQNAAELRKLRQEEEALVAILAVDITGTGIMETDLEALRTKLGTIRTTAITLQATIEQNTEGLEDTLAILQKNTNEYEKAIESEKRRGQAIKGNIDILKDLLQNTIDYNKSISAAPMAAFKANEKIFESILRSQKASIDETAKGTKLSKEAAKTAKNKLDIEYEIEKAMRTQNVLMERRKKDLNSIIKLAEDYRDINVEIRQKIANSILELKKLGKERYRSDILALELKAIKDRISVEKESLALSYKIDGLSEKEYQNKLLTLDAEGSKLVALAKVNDILEKQKKIYGEMTEDTNAIKSTIADWFSNQKALLDDLQSRGSLKKIFGRLFEGVQQIIAQRDAQIIAEAITGNIQNYVQKVRGGITEGIADATVKIGKVIEESIESNQLPALLRKAIEDPASFMITGTKDAIIAGWEHVASVHFPKLARTIVTSFAIGAQYEPQITPVTVPGLGLSSDFYSGLIKALRESRKEEKETKTEVGTNRSTESIEKSNEEILKVSSLHLDGILREEALLSQLSVITTQGSANIVAAIVDLSAAIGRDITGPVGARASVAAEKAKEEETKALMNALIRQVGALASTFLTSAMIKSGYDQGAMQLGGSIGAIIGSVIPGVGTALGMIGGTLLGGLLGGKKDEEEVVRDIRQIRDNTVAMVDRLSPSIFHAPSDFVLPVGGGFGSVVITNTFHISGEGASGVAETLESQLEDLYARSTKRNSILR